jgi:cytochrome c peroxidase
VDVLCSDYDRRRLSGNAQAGRTTFNRDCADCHSEAQFKDVSYRRPGARDIRSADYGLYEATGGAADKGKFRTPSLRIVVLTGPWWHDGSRESLEAAITRPGLSYGTDEIVPLIAFLGAVTDLEFTQRRALAMPDKACGQKL